MDKTQKARRYVFFAERRKVWAVHDKLATAQKSQQNATKIL